MYIFLSKDVIYSVLTSYGFNVSIFNDFQGSLIFLIGNIIYLMTIFIFVSVFFRILTRLKRLIFNIWKFCVFQAFLAVERL